MAFDAMGFLQKYNIPFVTEGHKHCRYGWIQVKCPFCTGRDGWHLGFEISKNWWNCWRCGYHRTWEVVNAFVQVPAEAKKALFEFKGRPIGRQLKKEKAQIKELELPEGGLQDLTRRAKQYLASRNFDFELLQLIWKVRSTANFGCHKYRLFIPFYFNNQLVTWQTRDIVGNSDKKYLAQSEKKEIMNNKSMLYGLDQATGKKCVVVEGVTDVWRLGPGAVSLQGIKYKPAQVSQLANNFEEVFILFDPEEQARIQAQKLACDLSLLGTKTFIVDFGLDCDPADLQQNEADALMRELVGFGGY